jgi:hypothetical protein
MNDLEKAVIEHKEVGSSLPGTGPNPFIRIHTFCLVQGDWARRNIFFWGCPRKVHGIPEFHISDMEF